MRANIRIRLTTTNKSYNINFILYNLFLKRILVY